VLLRKLSSGQNTEETRPQYNGKMESILSCLYYSFKPLNSYYTRQTTRRIVLVRIPQTSQLGRSTLQTIVNMSIGNRQETDS